MSYVSVHRHSSPVQHLRMVALGALIAVSMLASYPFIPPHSVVQPSLTPDFSNVPLSFIPNLGQTDPDVRFHVQGLGGMLFFASREVVLSLPNHGADVDHTTLSASRNAAQSDSTVLSLHFEEANPSVYLTGVDPLPGHVNFMIGNDPAQWQTQIPTFAGVLYEDLYPGIDLRYDGQEGQLKGTYIVSPGVDPNVIRWRYDGVFNIRADPATGDLQIVLDRQGKHMLVEKAPVAWQIVEGNQMPVQVRYQAAADGRVRFVIEHYDTALPLVIDPTLTYSSFLGGSDTDVGRDIAVDAAGNIYIAGDTFSTDFPTAHPLQPQLGGGNDVFVTKLNAQGTTIQWSTFLGGNLFDEADGIAVDDVGNVYVTGDTTSANFPIKNARQPTSGGLRDAFVAKLNAQGNTLAYSTFLGGNRIEEARALAVDHNEQVYVVGVTDSPNFPIANALDTTLDGDSDAFVAKLNPSGNALRFSTYFGGNDTEDGYDITLDQAGDAYISGLTFSADFPLKSPVQATRGGGGGAPDAFVTKMNADGSGLQYSTYLGGSDYDFAFGIAVDDQGATYIGGITFSPDFPTRDALDDTYNGGDGDAFVTKLTPQGYTFAYSSYLGGSGIDKGNDIAVDRAGAMYIVGDTDSTDFPIIDPVDGTFNGVADAFVTKVHPQGSALTYSTFLGGTILDTGIAIAIDDFGAAYITGQTASANFPTVRPLQPTLGDQGEPRGDAFVVKLSDPQTPPILPRAYIPVIGR